MVLASIGALVAYLSSAPAYQHFAADQALLKVTFIHGGQHPGGCRERTAEELQELAPNMRRKLSCPRERLPVVIQLEVDGRTVHHESVPPSGLHDDGPSVFYGGFPLSAGDHTITVRLRDSDRADGFDYEGTHAFSLSPAQLMIVQFRPESGGFLFR
jgi:hypothetical protein